MFKRIKQFFCAHTFRISEIQRLNADIVKCPCSKCRKVYHAICGLYLPGTLIWDWDRPSVH